jgi:hypothetical protein
MYLDVGFLKDSKYCQSALNATYTHTSKFCLEIIATCLLVQ